MITAHNLSPKLYSLFYELSAGLRGCYEPDHETYLTTNVDKALAYNRKRLDGWSDYVEKYSSRDISAEEVEKMKKDRDSAQKQLREIIQTIEREGVKYLAKDQRRFYLSPGDCVQTEPFYFATPTREMKGIYDLYLFLSRQDIIGYLQEHNHPIPFESYQKAIELEKKHQEIEHKSSLIHGELERLCSRYGKTIFWPPGTTPRDVQDLEKKFSRAYDRELKAKDRADEELHCAISIFQGLNKPQIHVLGNLEPVESSYTREAKPLCREHLGEELSYAIDQFLHQSSHRRDFLSVPYLVHKQGRTFDLVYQELDKETVMSQLKDFYGGGPSEAWEPLLTGLSLDDLRQLVS